MGEQELEILRSSLEQPSGSIDYRDEEFPEKPSNISSEQETASERNFKTGKTEEQTEPFKIFRSKNTNSQIISTEPPPSAATFSFSSDSEPVAPRVAEVGIISPKHGQVKFRKSPRITSKINVKNTVGERTESEPSHEAMRSRTTSFTEMAQESFEDLELKIAREVPEPGSDLVDYFEKRLKEFECDLNTTVDEEVLEGQSASGLSADVESESESSQTSQKMKRKRRLSHSTIVKSKEQKKETASESDTEPHSQPQLNYNQDTSLADIDIDSNSDETKSKK